MWEIRGVSDEEFRLTFRATRVSMRQLVALIVGCVVVGGGVAAASMIAFSTESGITLYRSASILVGGAIGVVMVLVLLWVFSWRRNRYTISWDESGVRVEGAGSQVALPWASIERVLIRTNTDYARVELRRTDGTSMTFLAGFGSQDVRKTDAIDDIPDGVVGLLRRHQLIESTRKRDAPGLRIFASNPMP